MFLRQGLEVVGTYGYSGQNAAYIRAQLPNALANRPRYLFVLAGINSVQGGASADAIIADLRGILGLCRARGTTVLLSTILPCGSLTNTINSVAQKRAVIAAVNTWITTESARLPHVIVVPMGDAIDDGSGTFTPIAGTTQDGTHPNTFGAQLLAQRAAAILSAVFVPDDGELPITAGDTRNAITNGLLTGTGGGLNFANNPGVATGWQVNTTGTQTVVPSKIARGDYGAWQQLQITAGTPSTADGTNEAHLSWQLPAAPVSGGAINVGDIVVGLVEFETDADAQNLSMLEVQLRNPSTASKARALGAANSSDTARMGNIKGVIRTPKLVVPADALTLFVFASGLTAGTTATVRIGRSAVLKPTA